MNLARKCKALFYPWIPSASQSAHAKMRKGLLYRSCPLEVLECQREQDRIFWERFLRPGRAGKFLEIGAGDGVVGSHTLGLEQEHGWDGALIEPGLIPRRSAMKARKCEVWGDGSKFSGRNSLNLLAIHRPAEFSKMWEDLRSGKIRPEWVVVENREPDPCWCRLLEDSGYRMKFFFHDDEYFQLTRR